MALDDSDTGAGCQAAAIFPQTVSEFGLALKLPQVFDSQRQAQATVADKGHIITPKDDRPKWDVVFAVFARQFDLDRHLLVRLIDDAFSAILIYALDQSVEYRVERCLCSFLH